MLHFQGVLGHLRVQLGMAFGLVGWIAATELHLVEQQLLKEKKINFNRERKSHPYDTITILNTLKIIKF